MFKTQKARIMIVVIVVMSVLAMSVSAEYLNVDKYGVYNGEKPLSIGNPIPSGVVSGRWALSGVMPDYTYDCWIQLSFSDSVPDGIFYITDDNDSYYSTNNPDLYYYLTNGGFWTRLTKQLGSVEKVPRSADTPPVPGSAADTPTAIIVVAIMPDATATAPRL